MYLFAEKNGIPLPESPLVKIVKEAPLEINKSITDSSANFILPDSWIIDELTLYTKLVDVQNNNIIDGMSIDVSFVPRRNPIIYVVEINTGTAEVPILGRPDILDRTIEAFKAMFPSRDITIIKKPWTTIGACTGCNFYDINDKLETYFSVLSWTRLLQSLSFIEFTDFPDQIYGYAPAGGGLAYPTWWNWPFGVSKGSTAPKWCLISCKIEDMTPPSQSISSLKIMIYFMSHY